VALRLLYLIFLHLLNLLLMLGRSSASKDIELLVRGSKSRLPTLSSEFMPLVRTR